LLSAAQVAEGFATPGQTPLITPPRRRSDQLSDAPKTGPDFNSPNTYDNSNTVAIGANGAGAAAAKETSLGFVQQHDVLMPTLTVTETILFGMMFREHVKSNETEDAAGRVAALLSDLGLQCAPFCVCSTGPCRHATLQLGFCLWDLLSGMLAGMKQFQL
jgi:hypothetical protein